ncbi:Flp family type IVb pilin [Oceanimonas smirnovii]|uniref:Flp family type IVb pilin n=1 Tax=Oceanimonas smirnovii TaxID=264574 RepID=UPI003FD37B1A
MNHLFIKFYVYCKLKSSALLQREEGASAIEYGIIAGLIAVGIIVSVGDIGDQLADFFTQIKDNLTTASTD